MHPSRLIAALAATAIVGGAGFATISASAETQQTTVLPRSTALATLIDANGNGVGRARFTQWGDGPVTVVTRVTVPAGSPEFHGFHVHANADNVGCLPGTGFTGVGGHWDVGGNQHGTHSGDLTSLQRRSSGTVETTFRVDKFDVADLIGRAAVVHAGPDNFGNVPLGTAVNQYTDNGTAYSGTGGTAATGNSGARFACGVIAQQ